MPDHMSVRLQLKSQVFDTYQSQAQVANQEPEDVMVRRLEEYKDHDAFKGRRLTLSPEERQAVEKLFEMSFTTGQQLVDAIQKAVSLNVGEIHVPLGDQLLGRLKSRCTGLLSFDKWLAEKTKHCLEHVAGMR